jgi:hypothetical protein
VVNQYKPLEGLRGKIEIFNGGAPVSSLYMMPAKKDLAGIISNIDNFISL